MARTSHRTRAGNFESEMPEITPIIKKDTMDVDVTDVMENLNAIPKDTNGVPDEKFSKALVTVYHAHMNGQLQLGDDDKAATQVSLSVLAEQFGKPPTFYIFHMPVKKSDNLKFVAAVEHDDQFLLGHQCTSKAAARASAALVLIHRLELDKKLRARISSNLKRQNDNGFNNLEPQPKKLATERQDVIFMEGEELSPRTKYFLTITSKNAIQILNEIIAKKGYKAAVFDIVNETKCKFTATCKVDGRPEVQSIISDNKKQAKASAARLMLDLFIAEGLIATPTMLRIPTSLPQPSFFKDFVRNICYNALIDAVSKNSICYVADPRIAGCIMVNSVDREATLVSWACGSYAGPIAYNNDGVVRDCDCLVLCKRGLQKLLFRELVVFNSDKSRSIFYNDKDATCGQLTLRPSITFHFFMNYVPKINETGPQFLSTKETQGMQKFNKKAQMHLSMSTVDKILKWNVVGVQGAVLSAFIKPIYIKSFVIQGSFNRSRMEEALATRAPPMGLLPTGYALNVPFLECDETTHPAFDLGVTHYSPGDRPAVVWHAVTEEYELLSASSGLSISAEMTSISRYGLCIDVWAVWRLLHQEPPSRNYTDFKRTATGYNHTLRTLKENLVANHLGLWAQK